MTLDAVFALLPLVLATQGPPPPADGTKAAGAADPHCHHESPASDPPAPLRMDRKSVLLRKIRDELTTGLAPFVGRGTLPELERRLAAVPANGDVGLRFQLHMNLGDTRLNEGDGEGAIADFTEAKRLAQVGQDQKALIAAMKRLAIAWLRVGERANCAARHNEDSCIFPLSEGAVHVEKTGSKNAAKVLLELLIKDPNDLTTMWLLNIAHMTLGTWPAGVPKHFRIEPEALAAEYDLPRMVDIAPKLGLNSFTLAGGSCIDDFTGDGRLDILVSSMDPAQPLRLFQQKEDGTYENIAQKVGLDGQLGGLQFIHFDANNDGRLDILVQRGAWMKDFGAIPNSLLIQQPDGSFLDRTLEAGVEVRAPSQTAAVADIDNDGDLDLFLGNESNGGKVPNDFLSCLFLNRGDGTFEDITARAGVQNGRFCKGVAFGDYDGDRLPDLYVSNMRAPNRLYHNNGDGTFTDVAMELGVQNPHDSFSCFFLDYNNDGALDLYVSCYTQIQRSDEIGAFYRNGASGSDTQRLYENDGRGSFRNVTRARGLDRSVFPMGSNFGDVDNDGWPDLYLATGDPELTSLWPNVMYRNDRGRTFQDVTSATRTGNLQKGHGVSFGDLDRDGDQDLFVQMGGAVVDDGFFHSLYENPGHGNHWLTVNLIGHRTNRFGLGVRLKATIEEPSGARDVYAFVGMNSSFGGNSLQEEMGLGQAKRLLSLEVYWPTTGQTDTFTDVPMDKAIVVEEGVGWRPLTIGAVSNS